MRRITLLLSLLTAASARASSPADAVASAWKDLSTITHKDRQSIRYQSLYAVPEKDREEFLKVLAFVVNSLSRKRILAPVRTLPEYVASGNRASIVLVTPDLVRLDIRNYGWTKEVYERLATVDPYFHLRIRIDEKATKKNLEKSKPDLSREFYREGDQTSPPGEAGWMFWEGGSYGRGGPVFPKGWYSAKSQLTLLSKGLWKDAPVATDPKNLVEKSAAAPWAEPKILAQLISETQSEAPILRADWFFTQVAINRDRVAGYYAFLGLKSRKDFEALAGFDLKLAQKKESEIASIIQKSGVSIRNRQIYRFGAVDSGYWQTRDVFKDQTKQRNAINSLNGDYKHDAEEYYTRLSNGLFGYYLCDDQGVQQDTAPDEVGGDSTTTNNNFQIQIFLSCVRCHVEGLRPLNDYGRKLFSAPAQLVTYDEEKFRRLEQLYLVPMQRDLDRDVQVYRDALMDLNGVSWTPARNSVAMKRAWKMWHDDDVTPEIAAREIGGITAEQLIAKMKKYSLPVDKGGLGQVVPNVMLAYFHEKPLPILREHFEEVYHVFQLIAGGYVLAQPEEKK